MTLDDVRKKLSDINKLGYGWDGFFALPITNHAMNNANLFLTLLNDTILIPEVGPVANGGIQFELVHHERELHVYCNKKFETLQIDEHGFFECVLSIENSNSTHLKKMITWLLGDCK